MVQVTSPHGSLSLEPFPPYISYWPHPWSRWPTLATKTGCSYIVQSVNSKFGTSHYISRTSGPTEAHVIVTLVDSIKYILMLFYTFFCCVFMTFEVPVSCIKLSSKDYWLWYGSLFSCFFVCLFVFSPWASRQSKINFHQFKKTTTESCNAGWVEQIHFSAKPVWCNCNTHQLRHYNTFSSSLQNRARRESKVARESPLATPQCNARAMWAQNVQKISNCKTAWRAQE